MNAHRVSVLILALGGALAAAGSCKRSTAGGNGAVTAASTAAPVVDDRVRMYFEALPARFDKPGSPATEARIALGRALYYDPRLSKNHDVSCNSCHDLAAYGVDGKPTSTGHRRQHGGRNAPTVYNAGPYVAQFWDGRAADLEEQAKGPVLNPVEMAMPDAGAVTATLRSIPGYAPMFSAAFPGEKNAVTFENAALAIGAFERGLVTPGRFDRFLAGDETALTEAEKAGMVSFRETGCTTCHNGPSVGGTSFQRLGLVTPYPDQHDTGRFGITHLEADRMVFKVPSLRNIDRTAPYFHDGSLTELPTVVRTMARHQLGKELRDDEVDSIVTFLHALTGPLPQDYIGKPELPADGPRTPAADPS